MNRNRILLLVGVLIVVAAISAFMLMQSSPEDILTQAIETSQTVNDGHAIVAFEVDSPEQDASGTVEVWARSSEDGPGSFRVNVLDASEADAQGAVIVSNGETLWAYSPSKNEVFVGTPEEAKALMENSEFAPGDFGQMPEYEGDKPETAEEAVEQITERFNLSLSGTETVAGENSQALVFEPIPEQMPPEFSAAGGLFNMWVSQDSNLPLAGSYTGGSFGEFSATVVEYEVNVGVDDALFTFDIPAGAEVVTFADLEPKSLTLEEAGANAEFTFLIPAETPEGATLVDILDVRGTLVQRYTLPEGGSFTVAQGISEETSIPADEGQSVELRGTTGQIFESEDGGKVLLAWTEGDLFFSVAGDLTPEQALGIAESLQ
ncbi:MAG: DUF4367 domain-containing protein [Chloroflexi bacterium]|nr:MAG: DUF4367 domain-containing protein [Chloroflexota bacterium]MBL1194283.1 DUF4367 domain-containing protein [Chloroflexota bacterium]NOH11573.1 DUF4367 domain-containing protein [Chloroflexota bacterium]